MLSSTSNCLAPGCSGDLLLQLSLRARHGPAQAHLHSSMSISCLGDNTGKAVSVPTHAPATCRGSVTHPGYQICTPSYEGPSPQQLLTLLLGQGSTHSATAVCAQPPYRTPLLFHTNGRGQVCCSSAAARQGCPPAASNSPAWAGTCGTPSC